MMFQGTYTSDFYRAIRNLLHDQVSLQTLHAPAGEEHSRARSALDRRWQELMSGEMLNRSVSRQAAVR
jgi:anaerobic magnesium-protoporphyrin IX monomethyl ester cyclase